ncbi:MAG: hypothetical protein LUD52_06415 [Opitutae bacterium]|nr:hypothetical protein [Opitutae bacterium]
MDDKKRKTDNATKRNLQRGNEQRFWFMVFSPEIFKIPATGEEFVYNSHNDKNRKRSLFQSFKDAKKGDIVIGYESTPTKKIIAKCEVIEKPENDDLSCKVTDRFPSPISYEKIKTTNGLEKVLS